MLLVCLLILFTSPTWSEPLTPEQVVSSIEPTKWYLGSDVRDTMSQVLTLAQDSIQTTTNEAVRAATTSLVTMNTELATENVKLKVTTNFLAVAAGVELGLLLTATLALIVVISFK